MGGGIARRRPRRFLPSIRFDLMMRVLDRVGHLRKARMDDEDLIALLLMSDD